MIKFTLLSVDAWRDYAGWHWNDCFAIENDIYIEESELTSRKILKLLRSICLSEYSKGRVRVVEDMSTDGYIFEIQNKNTGEPLFALSSVH